MDLKRQKCRTEYKSVTNGAQNTWLRFLYDSQGRRFEKKVTVAGTTTLHHRYIYRGYLQIAALDLTRSAHPALWFVTWAPSQPTATRPLAIQKDRAWFTYGYDLTKNICEVFGPAGYIRTAYAYAPFGAVTASGDVTQPFQWSSEHYDSELDLVYYNYCHYSPSLGRFLARDPIEEQGGLNLYAISMNNMVSVIDLLGLEWFPGTSPWVRYECCGGKKYSTFSSCCISSAGKQTIHSRKEKNYTGVSYYMQRTRWYYFPIYRPWSISQFFLEHAWFNIDNGAWRAGFYPKWDFPSGVYIGEEKYALEEGSALTFKKDIYLSVCEYDVEKFSQCVKDKVGEGNNCLDWVYDTINACKKELKRK